MTVSLRAKVVLPLVVLSAVSSIVFSIIVLDTLEQNLRNSIAAQIRSTYALVAPLLHDDPSARVGTSIIPADHRNTVLVRFGPDGQRLSPLDPTVNSAFTKLPASSGDVPGLDSFLERPYVGLLFPIPEASMHQAAGEIAVLVNSRVFRLSYNEVRIRVQLLSVLFVVLIAGVGNLVASHLNGRIDRIRRHVAQAATESPILSDGPGADLLDELAADILGAQRRTMESQKEIARLQVMRSQFLSNVSHEVRTPLFSLKGFLETLLDGGIDDPEVNRTFVEKALHHAQRIDNLLRDLIDITRIESGEMRMSFRHFPLSSLLDQLQADHVDLAAKQQQALRIEGLDENIKVIGDKERLQQALSNLVENALKYSPPGSSVVIGITPQRETVDISVTDNGPGIAQEHVGRIFERFYRVDPDRSRDVGGTGLGLAIVKHIVEAHDSDIRVTSRKGSGSTFSFTLRR